MKYLGINLTERNMYSENNFFYWTNQSTNTHELITSTKLDNVKCTKVNPDLIYFMRALNLNEEIKRAQIYIT